MTTLKSVHNPKGLAKVPGDRMCVYGGVRVCRGLNCDPYPCAHGLQITQEAYDKLKAYQQHLIYNHLEIFITSPHEEPVPQG